MKNYSFLFWILLLVNGVSGADENTVKLTLMVGDSVILNSSLNAISNVDTMRWFFKEEGQEEERIAEISEGTKKFSDPKGKFTKKLDLDKNTASLTITDISMENTGEYKLKKSKNIIISFIVSVKDEKPGVSVKEGKNVVLVTGLEDIQPYGLILTFKSRTIAEINKNDRSGNNIRDARLLLDILNGSLIISDSATTDTGDYSLTMSSSTHSVQRTISVTVSSPDSGVGAGAEAGIIVGLLVFLWCLQL